MKTLTFCFIVLLAGGSGNNVFLTTKQTFRSSSIPLFLLLLLVAVPLFDEDVEFDLKKVEVEDDFETIDDRIIGGKETTNNIRTKSVNQ